MTFQDKFRAALDAAGMTQREFSTRFSVPIQTVSAWAQGSRAAPDWAQPWIIEKIEQAAAENVRKAEMMDLIRQTSTERKKK